MSNDHFDPIWPIPISTHHDLSAFRCGKADLDEWLKRKALANEIGFSRTYVITRGPQVIAYYCLSAGSVERKSAPRHLGRGGPKVYPVAILGRLAVDGAFAGQGLGKRLLLDALRRVARIASEIGVSAVLVHARDEEARSFYLRHARFTEFPAESLTLFLPVKAIIAESG